MSAQEFLDEIIAAFYDHLIVREDDNYDLIRFPAENKDQFRSEDHRLFMQYFLKNYRGFYDSYALLCNDSSRNLFRNLILYKLLGHQHVRIKPGSFSEYKRQIEEMKNYEMGVSEFKARFSSYDLMHFRDIPFRGCKLSLESLYTNLAYSLLKDMYSYHEGSVNIAVESGDVVVEGGTCIGENTVKFAVMGGPKGHVYSFDPLSLHLDIARYNLRQNGVEDQVTLLEYGMSDHVHEVSAQKDQDREISPAFSIQDGDEDIPLTTIDHVVDQESLKKVDFVKMDIEGAELAALRGAAETIKKHRPKLAISLYHKIEDFIAIPQYLQSLCSSYDFYLDHYTIFASETVLFAIDREKR